VPNEGELRLLKKLSIKGDWHCMVKRKKKTMLCLWPKKGGGEGGGRRDTIWEMPLLQGGEEEWSHCRPAAVLEVSPWTGGSGGGGGGGGAWGGSRSYLKKKTTGGEDVGADVAPCFRKEGPGPVY